MLSLSVEHITPEIAKIYLSLQDQEHKNRPLRKWAVQKYARMLRDGMWPVTHQGIAFGEDGYLRDGQHRLTAVIVSGVSADFVVARGLSLEACRVIDTGIGRSWKDMVQMTDAYKDEPAFRSNSTRSMFNYLCRFNLGSKYCVGDIQIANLYAAFHQQSLSIWENGIVRDGHKNASVNAAAFSAIMSGVSDSDIHAFYSIWLKSDISESAGKNAAAALNWQRQVSDAKSRHRPIGREQLYLGTQNAIWNYVNNTNVRTIKIPKVSRYDVSKKLLQVLEGEE